MADPWFTQGIYWSNFPSGIEENLQQFRQQVVKTKLKHEKRPYVLFTGTTHIDFKFITDNKELVQLFVMTGLDIYLYEPLSLYVDNEHTHGYYSEYHSKHNSLTRATELDCIDTLVNDTKIPITVHTCDYHPSALLQQQYPNFRILCDDFFLKSANTEYKPRLGKNIKVPFWCGNGRYTVHRHLIMCHLEPKPGVYSWYYTCEDLPSSLVNIEWTEELELTKLAENNTRLNKKILHIDGRAHKCKISESSKFALVKKVFQPSRAFMRSYRSCFCAVVTETRFAQPMANISEKVLFAAITHTPMILVAPPRSLEYMKKLGFKTFGEFWDESYDQEENHSLRLQKVFNVIDTIEKMSIEEMAVMYERMKPIVKHNCKVAQELAESNVVLTS